MNDAPVVEAVGLTKSFGDVRALDGLDLAVSGGEVVALLGPNGAGKTTFVRTVATLVRPDRGTLRVAGVDVRRNARQVRRMIGLAGQHAAVEEALTGRENLEMVARLYGRDRRTARACAEVVLRQIRLVDAADRQARTYSGGMRRRLDLGVSLVGRPHLLLLDEPTTGLDPRSRLELWETIRSLAAGGTHVLLTTQHLDEADHLAGRVVIIDRGRVIADGTPEGLKRRIGRDVVDVQPAAGEDLDRAARLLAPLGLAPPRIDAATRRISVPVGGATAALPDVVRTFDRHGVRVEDMALRRPTLDEVFLALTEPSPVTGPTPGDAAGRSEPVGVRAS